MWENANERKIPCFWKIFSLIFLYKKKEKKNVVQEKNVGVFIESVKLISN